MNSIELIVRIIIKRGDKILFCQMKKAGHYFLPGGHVEFGDSLVDTIYKELEEETGLKKEQISNIKYKDFLENFFNDGAEEHHELNMIFTALVDETLEINSRENHIAFEWIEVSEIPNINFLPKEMISKL